VSAVAQSEPDWALRLRGQGFRVTPQRQLVLEAVNRLDHATPESILVEVQRTAEGLNLSTVYRTLEVLERVGLVTHAHIGHGSPAYHSVTERPHLHLVCANCGKVTSVDADIAADFVATLVQRTGFHPDIGHLSLQGQCAECADTGAS
jgi:Fur family ferric uptake transcriptional regulator